MGRAKVEPIDIKLKPGATAVTQGRREIPIQYRKSLEKKIAELLKYDLIEGPLQPNRAKGWVHNTVITDKKWSSPYPHRKSYGTNCWEAIGSPYWTPEMHFTCFS